MKEMLKYLIGSLAHSGLHLKKKDLAIYSYNNPSKP